MRERISLQSGPSVHNGKWNRVKAIWRDRPPPENPFRCRVLSRLLYRIRVKDSEKKIFPAKKNLTKRLYPYIVPERFFKFVSAQRRFRNRPPFFSIHQILSNRDTLFSESCEIARTLFKNPWGSDFLMRLSAMQTPFSNMLFSNRHIWPQMDMPVSGNR